MSKIIGYIMTRQWYPGQLFCGTKPEEVAEAIRNELEANEGLAVDEIDGLSIAAKEYTQAEIDSMPEFPGW